jgi:hypothetical protein
MMSLRAAGSMVSLKVAGVSWVGTWRFILGRVVEADGKRSIEQKRSLVKARSGRIQRWEGSLPVRHSLSPGGFFFQIVWRRRILAIFRFRSPERSLIKRRKYTFGFENAFAARGDPTSPSATTNGRKTTGYVGQAARPPSQGFLVCEATLHRFVQNEKISLVSTYGALFTFRFSWMR